MAIIEATSCSYAHVAAAIAAASNGDTVLVPSGVATWGSMLSIGKGIYLIADGSEITNGAGATFLITYDPADYDLNQSFRLSGFSFIADGNYILRPGVDRNAPFTLNTKVRIDHNTFTNIGATIKGQFIYNNGTLYGVADNNTFSGSGYPIAHTGGGGGGDNESWWRESPQNIFSLGGQHYFYYEDNSFVIAYDGGTLLTDGEYCARYVFRYNDIDQRADNTYSMFDIHGTQGTPLGACFGAEIYGNDINSGDKTCVVLKQRSGQCLVFLNNGTGTKAPYNIAYTGGFDICPSDDCGLKVTHNTYWFRNRSNLTGAIWADNVTGGLNCCGLTNIPTLGRDVFSEGSTPAVTIGTLANRPETCTVGQGYWATNQNTSDLTNFVGVNPTTPISGTLYVCFETNVWTEFYTPYTYPHPLRGEAPIQTMRQSMRVRF
ncbi:MAG: hypothetical protein MUF84_11615 [Anaerolineae bacterium]|jgi:hypothetical protein|nr:hypothetical protein [Anaerolineae bacterium]